MYLRSFLCEEAKIKQRTPLKKELCEIGEEAIRESRFTSFFTFSSHTEYVKRESIIIAWVEKKILSFWRIFMFCMSYKTKQAQKNFRLSVCLYVCLAVRTWTFHVDAITFEVVSGSKQNLVGVFMCEI